MASMSMAEEDKNFNRVTSDRDHSMSRRLRGSTLAVVLGCLVILVLLLVGLWMASRFAKSVISDSRQQGFSMKQDLERSTREGMEQARRESELMDDSEAVTVDNPPDAVQLDERTKTQWIARVNEFITSEVLSAQLIGSEPDRSPTLRQALDRAVEKLDAGVIDHPAVEAAVRTMLASSYLSMDLPEEASWQGGSALEKLRTGFGMNHPYTGQAMRNLATIHVFEGRFDEAADLYESLFEIRHAADESPSEDSNQLLDAIRLLRSAIPARAVGLDRSEWPDTILQLLQQSPPYCSLKPLEF